MENTPTSADVSPGSRARAMFLIGIIVAFLAGLLVGYLVGSGKGGELEIPENVFAVEVGEAPQIGPANAPVTVVLFTDFQCPFCRKAAKMIERLRSRFGDDVRIVFKHYPMQKLHPEAYFAHEASVGAHKQGKFWAFHDRLFAHEGPQGRQDLETIARQAGLDIGMWSSDLNRRAHRSIVDADLKQGTGLGVTGTPTFFINGRRVVGANWKMIERVVRHEKKLTAELLESGVPAERIYETIMKDALKALQDTVPPPAPQPQPGPRIEDLSALYRVGLGNSTVIGKPDVPVTVVWFIDYQCPFSEKANAIVEKLRDSHVDAIRLVVKNNPQPRHPGAPLAAEAALAAGSQGKFRAMHDKLFANRDAQSREDLEGYAKELGLDLKIFSAALDGHQYLPTIKQEQKTARTLGATSTPTYFINGLKYKGNQPYDALEDAVLSAKLRAEKIIATGVPAKDVYKHIIKNGATSVQYQKPAGASSITHNPDPNIPLTRACRGAGSTAP
ncbi:MAG: thioredoxin domain-containing protein [Deltaproteobacteria bacterium]|nr:thioredoxin domain-containing protein [Deltaproteobacteria bacterium]